MNFTCYRYEIVIPITDYAYPAIDIASAELMESINCPTNDFVEIAVMSAPFPTAVKAFYAAAVILKKEAKRLSDLNPGEIYRLVFTPNETSSSLELDETEVPSEGDISPPPFNKGDSDDLDPIVLGELALVIESDDQALITVTMYSEKVSDADEAQYFTTSSTIH